MKFIINSFGEKLGYRFLNDIARQVKINFLHTVDEKKLIPLDKYFNENSLYKSVSNGEFSSLDVLTEAINNIVYDKFQDEYIFHVDYNKLYKNYNIKLDSICREITYGNMAVKGYPILLNIYNNLATAVNANLKKQHSINEEAEKTISK